MQPVYCMAITYSDGWAKHWSESYEAVKWKFDSLKDLHPDAIGTIVRLRIKRLKVPPFQKLNFGNLD